MLVTTAIVIGGLFVIATTVAAQRPGGDLISHRPYENVRAGLPRSARSTTALDIS